MPKTSFIVEFFPTDYREKLVKSQRSKGIPEYFRSSQSVTEARFERSSKKNGIQHLILSLPRRFSYNSAWIHRTDDSTLLTCQVSLAASFLEVNLTTRVFISSHSGTCTLACLIFFRKANFISSRRVLTSRLKKKRVNSRCNHRHSKTRRAE